MFPQARLQVLRPRRQHRSTTTCVLSVIRRSIAPLQATSPNGRPFMPCAIISSARWPRCPRVKRSCLSITHTSEAFGRTATEAAPAAASGPGPPTDLPPGDPKHLTNPQPALPPPRATAPSNPTAVSTSEVAQPATPDSEAARRGLASMARLASAWAQVSSRLPPDTPLAPADAVAETAALIHPRQIHAGTKTAASLPAGSQQRLLQAPQQQQQQRRGAGPPGAAERSPLALAAAATAHVPSQECPSIHAATSYPLVSTGEPRTRGPLPDQQRAPPWQHPPPQQFLGDWSRPQSQPTQAESPSYSRQQYQPHYHSQPQPQREPQPEQQQQPQPQQPHFEAIIIALKLALASLQAAPPRRDGRSPATRAVQLASTLADLCAAGLPLDALAICAGVVAEAAELGALRHDVIRAQLGPSVAALVHDMLLVRQAPRRIELLDDEGAGAIREWCLAFHDVRACVVEVVNWWDELEHMGTLPAYEQQALALEALQVGAPLGHALGLGSLSALMEDTCLKVLFPESYGSTAAWLRGLLDPAEDALFAAQQRLLAALEEHPAFGRLAGGMVVKARTKSLFSVMKKLLHLGDLARGGRSREELYDLLGMRAVVQPPPFLPPEEAEAAATRACYVVQDVACTLWRPIPTRSKDYIVSPKPNGYQSIHLTLQLGRLDVDMSAVPPSPSASSSSTSSSPSVSASSSFEEGCNTGAAAISPVPDNAEPRHGHRIRSGSPASPGRETTTGPGADRGKAAVDAGGGWGPGDPVSAAQDVGPGGGPLCLELQIRTAAMDRAAESGDAAHAVYKGGMDARTARQLQAWTQELQRRLSAQPKGRLLLRAASTASLSPEEVQAAAERRRKRRERRAAAAAAAAAAVSASAAGAPSTPAAILADPAATQVVADATAVTAEVPLADASVGTSAALLGPGMAGSAAGQVKPSGNPAALLVLGAASRPLGPVSSRRMVSMPPGTSSENAVMTDTGSSKDRHTNVAASQSSPLQQPQSAPLPVLLPRPTRRPASPAAAATCVTPPAPDSPAGAAAPVTSTPSGGSVATAATTHGPQPSLLSRPAGPHQSPPDDPRVTSGGLLPLGQLQGGSEHGQPQQGQPLPLSSRADCGASERCDAAALQTATTSGTAVSATSASEEPHPRTHAAHGNITPLPAESDLHPLPLPQHHSEEQQDGDQQQDHEQRDQQQQDHQQRQTQQQQQRDAQQQLVMLFSSLGSVDDPEEPHVIGLAARDAAAAAEQLFRHLDVNGDGRLSLGEVRQVLMDLAAPASESDAASLMAALDRNGDGGVSMEEFVEGLRRAQLQHEQHEQEQQREARIRREGEQQHQKRDTVAAAAEERMRGEEAAVRVWQPWQHRW